MTPNEIREKYLAFYKAHGHAIVPSSLLVPENDPTTKLCVVILTYDGNGMMRLRAHKMNAGVLEAVGMLSMAEADYINQD